jgi:hypothetical protein
VWSPGSFGTLNLSSYQERSQRVALLRKVMRFGVVALALASLGIANNASEVAVTPALASVAGSLQFTKALTVAISSPGGLHELWSRFPNRSIDRNGKPLGPPQVDFSKYTLVIVALGARGPPADVTIEKVTTSNALLSSITLRARSAPVARRLGLEAFLSSY